MPDYTVDGAYPWSDVEDPETGRRTRIYDYDGELREGPMMLRTESGGEVGHSGEVLTCTAEEAKVLSKRYRLTPA